MGRGPGRQSIYFGSKAPARAQGSPQVTRQTKVTDRRKSDTTYVPFLEEPERALWAVVVGVGVAPLVGPQVRIAGKALVAGLAHVLKYNNAQASMKMANRYQRNGEARFVSGTQLEQPGHRRTTGAGAVHPPSPYPSPLRSPGGSSKNGHRHKRREKGAVRDGSTGFSPVWVRIWVRRSAWRWNLRLDHKNDTDRSQHR